MAVKQSPADGYTLFLAHVGTHALNTSLVPNLPYDPIADFQPVAMLFAFQNILVAPTSTPANSVAELIDLARKKPGGLSYGSQGVGSGAHLLGAMLQQLTGAPLVHVPYPGAQQQLVDMIGGRIDFSFFAYQSAKPLVADGKLKILASAAPSRRKELPQVPTMVESGYPEMVLQVWYGLVAPAGTPADVVKRLNEELTAAGNDPELIKALDQDGLDVLSGTPADFTALMKSDAEKWGKVIRTANIR
jgi:tripartite-type tricarboxylate transporter receptor subunit TctC